ncbi:hypothetical protein PENTCL1PPCAC_24705, partial [Pristionchus entomophagus]
LLPFGSKTRELLTFQISGDSMFNISTVATLKMCSQKGAPAFFYVFDYYNPKCLGAFAQMTPCLEANHGSETAYIFNTGLTAQFEFDNDDKHVADMTMRAFANFAKRGNPNDEGASTWLPCDLEHPGRHMRLDIKPIMHDDYEDGRCNRWLTLMKHTDEAKC